MSAPSHCCARRVQVSRRPWRFWSFHQQFTLHFFPPSAMWSVESTDFKKLTLSLVTNPPHFFTLSIICWTEAAVFSYADSRSCPLIWYFTLVLLVLLTEFNRLINQSCWTLWWVCNYNVYQHIKLAIAESIVFDLQLSKRLLLKVQKLQGPESNYFFFWYL